MICNSHNDDENRHHKRVFYGKGVDSPQRFSLKAFLSSTKFFIDPSDIPDSFKPRLEDIVIVERVLGAFFSILFFLARGTTVIR
jgi:hypothetical protein